MPISGIEFPLKICELDSEFISPYWKKNDWHTSHNRCYHSCLQRLCLDFYFHFATELCSIFCASVVSILQKEKAFSHLYKQTMPTVDFFLAIDSQIHAFPLCDIPLWGEREREPHDEWTSVLFKQHAWRSHQNLVVPKALSCPHIPHRCLICRLVIKLICWFRDTRRVGITLSLCSNRIVMAGVHCLGCIIYIRKESNILNVDNLTYRLDKKNQCASTCSCE